MNIGESQITEIRLPDGSIVQLVDWVDRPMFSTIDLLSGFTDNIIPAFTYVVSDNVSGSQNITNPRVASERDTNIASPSTTASTEEMLVYNIKIEPYEWTSTPAAQSPSAGVDSTHWTMARGGAPNVQPQNLAILNFFTLIRLYISQKVYYEAGTGYFNQGFGPFSSFLTGSAAVAPIGMATPGLPSAEAARAVVIPAHIGGAETYNIDFVTPNNQFGADPAGVNFRNLVTAAGVQAAVNPDTVISLRILLEGLRKYTVG
jgi:hypothetical protein